MKGYIVLIRERTLDEQHMEIYNKHLRRSLLGTSARILSFERAHEEIEGEQAEGITLLEFDSVSAARAWYEGEDYGKIRVHRWKGADYRAILVQGEPT